MSEPVLADQFKPSLTFMKKFANKHVMVTGASGAIGTEVTLALIEAGVRKLTLWVKDMESIDERVRNYL